MVSPAILPSSIAVSVGSPPPRPGATRMPQYLSAVNFQLRVVFRGSPTAVELSQAPLRSRSPLALALARTLDLPRDLQSKSKSTSRSKNRPPILNSMAVGRHLAARTYAGSSEIAEFERQFRRAGCHGSTAARMAAATLSSTTQMIVVGGFSAPGTRQKLLRKGEGQNTPGTVVHQTPNSIKCQLSDDRTRV